MQMKDIKRKIKHYTPEIIASVSIALGTVAVFYIKKSLDVNAEALVPFTDADGKKRYSNGLHIVLENVEKDVWRDMDNREDQYRLVPHAVVWEDAR